MRALAIIAALLFTTSAYAQSGSSSSKYDCARVKKSGGKCKFIPIEADQIGGTTDGPVAPPIRVFEPPKHTDSLIRLRMSFRDMIVKTAERI